MIRFTIPVKTTNPLNGSQGRTRGAVYGEARRRRKLREATRVMWLHTFSDNPLMHRLCDELKARPVTVRLTRIAPRQLDSHDGLRASLKSIVDELAILLGCRVSKGGHADDSDPRVTWEFQPQQKGGVREYGVQVEIEMIGSRAQRPQQTEPK
jgi:hypothetical protein